MISADSGLRRLLFKAMMGALLGAIAGAINLVAAKSDAAHFWAAVAAGTTYMSLLAILMGSAQRMGNKTLLGAVSGFVAGTVWWVLALFTEDSFAPAAIAGICFGVMYAWSEARTTL